MNNLRLLVLLSCISLLACRGDSRMSQADPLVGCYILRAEPWKPPIPASDARYYVLPSLLQLHSDTAPQLSYLPGTYVATPPMRRDSVEGKVLRSRAFWRQRGKDSLDVKWTDGYSSVSAHLRHHGDTLTGLAEAFSDYLSPGTSIAVAQLVAVRTGCP